MNRTALLTNPQQALGAMRALWEACRPYLMSGGRLEVNVRPARRSSDQNAKLHAELTEIAEAMPWAGSKRTPEVWKRLLTAAWLRARGESVEILPALDGHGIDVVFRRTSDLTVAEMTELIDFIGAWKAEHCQPA